MRETVRPPVTGMRTGARHFEHDIFGTDNPAAECDRIPAKDEAVE